MRRFILSMVAAAGLLASGSARADVSIAVASPRGEAQTMAEWGPFARYLEAKTGQHVTLVPVAVNKIDETLAAHSVDLALCNPVQAMGLARGDESRLLASMILPDGTQFGGVVIANPKAGVATIANLKGKKVMALGKSSAGAYLFQAFEAVKAGLKVPDDFGQLVFAKKQDDIVLSVKAGIMDAGFVRTGILETMLKENKIAPGDVVVVDPRKGSPQALSTELYPEWYLVDVTKDGDKAAKTKAAALALPAADEAAKAARIQGFAPPLSPAPVEAMMKALKVPPYNQ